MAFRPCLACGVPVDGTRCRECRRPLERKKHNRAYDSAGWRRFRATLLARHLGWHGEICPGIVGHAPHPSADLTVDHIVPLAEGGAMFDEANVRILCRSENGRLGGLTAHR